MLFEVTVPAEATHATQNKAPETNTYASAKIGESWFIRNKWVLATVVACAPGQFILRCVKVVYYAIRSCCSRGEATHATQNKAPKPTLTHQLKLVKAGLSGISGFWQLLLRAHQGNSYYGA